MADREQFDAFCRETFDVPRSKTISRQKGERIVAHLKDRSIAEDKHFKFYVKSRKFELLQYPSLGLTDVLCVPAQEKVRYFFSILLKFGPAICVTLN